MLSGLRLSAKSLNEEHSYLSCVMMASMAADLLEEVKKREKDMGVEVDWSVDAMLNSQALSGAQESVATEFIIHMLGLDICATTIIGNAMKRGVSGGQKKRVTTGAYSCTPARLPFHLQ